MESSYLLDSQKTEGQQCLPNASKKKKIMESTAGGSLDSNPFDSLPTEILQKILGYLPVFDRVRVERVCKRWKNVSTERVWRDVQVLHIVPRGLITEYHRFNDSLLKYGKSFAMEDNELLIGADDLRIIKSIVSRAGQHVKKFISDLKPYDEPIGFVLSIIATHCHNIEKILLHSVEDSAIRVLSNFLEDNEQLLSIKCVETENILQILPLRDWKSLDIGFESPEEAWDMKLIALIENSPSLEKFSVSYLAPDILTAISKCEQLRTLYLPSWFGDGMYDQVMRLPILDRLTSLKLLELEDDADSIIDLLRMCINLKNLSFSLSRSLPSKLKRAVLTHPKLESLDLDRTPITGKILRRLQKFKRFRTTQSHGSMVGSGIFIMIMTSEYLEKLEIPKMRITTELFKKVAQNSGARRNILEIEVSTEIYEEALEICRGTKIRITEEKVTDDEAIQRYP